MPRRWWGSGPRATIALTCVCVLCGAASASTASAATLPPALVALEQKTGELKINSLRFSLQTSFHFSSGGPQLQRLAKQLGLESETSGVATIAPPAVDETTSLFGQKVTLRTVGEAEWVDFPRLASHDGGRPWVKLGGGGLLEILTVNGHPMRHHPRTSEPKPKEPKLAEPPFASLITALANAREVRELGPGSADGQPVTRFVAVLDPAQLKKEALASAAAAIASAARSAEPPPPLSATLEASIAADGLPVRTVVTEQLSHATVSATLDIPAVNFPLAISAPPASETISAHELIRLEKRALKQLKKRRR